MSRYALAIGLSSFLIFQIQPIMARAILPWFGGSAAVWTTCLLFFQAALLVGYGYAHLVRLKLPIRAQIVVHLGLLGASMLLLPILPGEGLKPEGGDDPAAGIVALLMACVGAQMVLVSASGPLLQHWLAVEHPDRSPYRLYALSNAASLLGLVSYPFLVEPWLSVSAQSAAWSWGYGLYGLACAACAAGLWRARAQQAAGQAAGQGVGAGRMAAWVGLGAAGSVMLLATSNQMSQDIAVTPFLWVLPLGIYLISFIICFDRGRWYVRRLWMTLFAGSVGMMFAVQGLEGRVEVYQQLVAYSALLLSSCMICHGELVRLKPPPERLTAFYLMLSLGGALGGAFVALVAPRIFNGYWELHVGIAAVTLAAIWQTGAPLLADPRRFRAALLGWASAAVAAVIAVAVVAYFEIHSFEHRAVDTRRNFYGVLRVFDHDRDTSSWSRTLVHGRIVHGAQFMAERPERPTRYYAPESGVALAIDLHPRRLAGDPMQIGVIGLGTGTLATYGRRGDHLQFFEIDPAVILACQRYFSFLTRTEATVDVTLGDARISLERTLAAGQPHRFDVLVVDAFSGDAIPVHLLTREALTLYLAHLAPGGIIALHISNRHLDLWPVAWSLAQSAGLDARFLTSKSDSTKGWSTSDWILLSSPEARLDHPRIDARDETSDHLPVQGRPWTDDHSDLLSILR